MENPPLWVWAIVVGLIIAGKFAYRWKTTKHLAKEMEQNEMNEKVIDSSKAMQDSKNKSNNNNNNTGSISNIRTTMSHKYSAINIVPVPLGTILKLGRGNYNASEIKNQNTSSLEYLDDDDGAFYF
jgi:hypothetical protein